MRYAVIYADPPWQYRDKSLNRIGAERHYPTMAVEDICALPIADICTADAALFLWVTNPLLAEGFQVMEAWGFTYRTVAFFWIKTNKRTNPNQSSFFPVDRFDDFLGAGQWTRSNIEICLLGIRGTFHRHHAGVRQIIYAPISKHSRKPPETRSRIVQLCGDVPRVELFAREVPAGWDVWGNEVQSNLTFNSQEVQRRAQCGALLLNLTRENW